MGVTERMKKAKSRLTLGSGSLRKSKTSIYVEFTTEQDPDQIRDNFKKIITMENQTSIIDFLNFVDEFQTQFKIRSINAMRIIAYVVEHDLKEITMAELKAVSTLTRTSVYKAVKHLNTFGFSTSGFGKEDGRETVFKINHDSLIMKTYNSLRSKYNV